MMRTLAKKGGGFLIELNRMETYHHKRNLTLLTMPLFTFNLLSHTTTTYSLSIRGHEDPIILKDDTDPISFCPLPIPPNPER